ncbi:MAG: NAD(P)/FAD-dependent oxidoreductase [Clostridiales bacterium]|nr:NAD(P)/FAD-dependent oxidoreductase [Clostridiales bacterium]
MIKRFDNVKLSPSAPESDLLKIAAKKLGAKVKYFKILKKSLDARDKRNIFWLYSVACSAEEEKEPEPAFERIVNPPQIAVVGSGPAGLFCALRLIAHGFKPVIIERGEPVGKRQTSCLNFFGGGRLNTESNVQFGEGGAGAFSDGKLNTRTKDGFNRDVLEGFVRFGAPEDVLYLNKPHVGSDKLYTVLQNIRAFITENGGEYLFDTKLVGIKTEEGELKSLTLKNVKSGEMSEMPVAAAVLAVGHSARDTYEMLDKCGVHMEPRDFAVGVRIEHLSSVISAAQYGGFAKYLPAADYQLVSHAHERTVFTFCMCPGGVVMPAASEEGGVVVNGMSNRARDGVNSNSALMVQMGRRDFCGDDLFAGVRFQREIERKAFLLGGGSYKAPCQLYKDFAADRISQSFVEVNPTYAAGTVFAPLSEILPRAACDALKAAVPDMGKKLKGFDGGSAVMTGVETRFSSPVKITRGDDGQSTSVKNLYPCGEGSGYSGGITSSAADGIRAAENIFMRFK